MSPLNIFHRLAKSQEPMADEYFARTFFERVVRNCFCSLDRYRHDKLHKRKVIKIGEKFYLDEVGHKLLFRFYCKRHRKRLLRRQYEDVENVAAHFLIRVALRGRLLPYIRISRNNKRCRLLWQHFVVHFNTTRGYAHFRKGLVWSRMWRGLNMKASHNFLLVIMAKVFIGWKDYNALSANADAYVVARYQEKVCRKIFEALKKEWEEQKAYIKSLMEKEGEEKRSKEEMERHLKRAYAAVTILQARVRGYQWRQKWVEIFISKKSGIELIQRFIRMGLAFREARRRRRLLYARENIKEERELDEMRVEEKTTKYLTYVFKAIQDIQRTYRGWIGRERGNILAMEFARHRGILYYEREMKIREKIKEQQGAMAAALLKQKNKAAIEIQRVCVRGPAGRKRARQNRSEQKMLHYCILVQAEYRRRLAEFTLRAKKREAVANMRYWAARRQRANYFKAMGFNKRKSKMLNIISSFLESVGLDPMSFNYRPMELIKETISDFYEFKRTLFREMTILYKARGDVLKGMQMRREMLLNQGITLKLYDAVKIVSYDHPHRGRTGIIVRIDTSIPGQPLYEIKLDHTPAATFVMMTTDALQMYQNRQPLTRIQKNPPLGNYLATLQKPIYGLVDPKEDPFYDGNRIDAAWIIQRGWRQYRARKIAARLRYEVWARAADTHRSWVNTLANTGTLTDHANTLYEMLRLKAKKSIFYDEIRHNLDSLRLQAAKKAQVKESKMILKEADEAITHRLQFLEAMTAKKMPHFSTGYLKFTRWKKLKMLYGLIRSGGTSIKDLFGPRGAQFMARHNSMVVGTQTYVFEQFKNSPHVRYSKLAIYQGEWSGIPLITELKPNGEGLLLFLDGWGFCEESKVLYLEIVKCRYLNAMDLDTSDPYCDIFCNGKNLQTSVKWKNLNPDYHEQFEIDVTNENATLNIQVKDKDIFGEDDFMGQIIVPIRDLKDKDIDETFLLKGEDVNFDEGFDRGEIHIRARWTVRAFEDDIALRVLKAKKATIIQAWARRIAAQEERKRLIKENKKLYEMVISKTLVMQSVVRMRLGRLELRKRRKAWRSAIKIQVRIRIMIAKRNLSDLMVLKFAAIKIQRIMRGKLARLYCSDIVARRLAKLTKAHTVCQKWVRRFLAQCMLEKHKKEKLYNPKFDEDGDIINEAPVKEWIDTYGYDEDPEYRLRRNRRLVQNAFFRACKTKYCRLLSHRFGHLFVEKYPTELSEEEKLSGEEMVDHEDFVSVFLPACRPQFMKRKDVLKNLKATDFRAVICISTDIDLKASAFYYLVTIQCMVRQRLAWKERLKLLKCNEAFAKLQRIFRMRHLKLHISAFKIQAFFHVILAKKRSWFKRREVNSIKTIQRGFRCYRAQMAMIRRRCVPPTHINILKKSSEVEFHGPEKLVDFKMHTFYVSESKEEAEIRFEFREIEALSEIWVQLGTFSLTPHRITVQVLSDKVLKKYTKVVDDVDMDDRGMLWHKFPIITIPSKYYKITFNDTSGDEDKLAVRQILFIRAKERSAKILLHPKDHIFTSRCGENSIQVGNRKNVELRVEADGWPAVQYQWFVNNRPVKGATKPRLVLILYCKSSHEKRAFRCLKVNAVH